jgi:hypothetical protein
LTLSVVGALADRRLNDQARVNIEDRLRIVGLLESAARLRHDARIGIGEVDLSGFANGVTREFGLYQHAKGLTLVAAAGKRQFAPACFAARRNRRSG